MLILLYNDIEKLNIIAARINIDMDILNRLD